ncbi:MAG: hypothetical protein CL608_25140 [Anaerolineaceae bacterium]|nr:hypothetical protein [Anaerolineaceae bacterium]
MKATKLIWSVLLLLLIGCTAVTTTDEPGQTAVPPEPQSTDEAESEEPPVTETPETEPEPTPTEDEDKQVSEPVTIDLGDVTPVPLEGTPVVQPAPGNPGLKDPVVQAMTDLSERVGADVEDIELVSLLEVTWRDGSIGCPEPGVAYTMALVPGQQLILRVNGEEYHYHSGKNSIFKYCGDPTPPLESMPINPLEPIPGQDE